MVHADFPSWAEHQRTHIYPHELEYCRCELSTYDRMNTRVTSCRSRRCRISFLCYVRELNGLEINKRLSLALSAIKYSFEKDEGLDVDEQGLLAT